MLLEVVVYIVRIIEQKIRNVKRYITYLSAITASCLCKRSTTFLINADANFLIWTSSLWVWPNPKLKLMKPRFYLF